METFKGHTTLEIMSDVCIGCSHCIKVCPTEALRVSGGKATIHADWCVDCGECYRACPTHAIRVVDDDFSQIYKYKERVLLLPALFYSQFSGVMSVGSVNQILSDLGFTEICVVEQSVDMLVDKINDYIEKADEKPVISAFCPSIVRLIQVRFPSLVDRIALLYQPMETTALYYKKKFEKRGLEGEDAGIFYITPCIGKTCSIKYPLGGYTSPVNGVLNMDTMYSRVYLAYKQKQVGETKVNFSSAVSSRGLLWATTGGEAAAIRGNALAIDGMDNVIEFLEKLEDDEVGEGLDYLELRACDESCSGGILTLGNRFVMADYLKKISNRYLPTHHLTSEYKEMFLNLKQISDIPAKSMIKYDSDIEKAIEKMEKAKGIEELLPGIDCGACGAPSCEAFSADIARDDANLFNCIFMQAIAEKEGNLSVEESIRIKEEIWGEKRFEISKNRLINLKKK